MAATPPSASSLAHRVTAAVDAIPSPRGRGVRRVELSSHEGGPVNSSARRVVSRRSRTGRAAAVLPCQMIFRAGPRPSNGSRPPGYVVRTTRHGRCRAPRGHRFLLGYANLFACWRCCRPHKAKPFCLRCRYQILRYTSRAMMLWALRSSVGQWAVVASNSARHGPAKRCLIRR